MFQHTNHSDIQDNDSDSTMDEVCLVQCCVAYFILVGG
jgi:hypothetical protein